MNPFLNKIKPKKLSTKILLGIVVLFSLYTVINKNYDKEIREPFRLAIHKDNGHFKNTYLIAHEFSKYLVDTPWDHAFYPILLKDHVYMGLNWIQNILLKDPNHFILIIKNNTLIFIQLTCSKYIEDGIKNTLNELMEEMKKAKDVFLRMYPEDELLLQEFDSTMEQSIIEFIKQIEKDPEKNEYYTKIQNYGVSIIYNSRENRIDFSLFK